MIMLESAVPLVALTLASAAGGLVTAELLLRAVRGATIRLPTTPYYRTLLIGVLIALVLVLSTMPLLRRISDPENARTE
ncbi:MAG: hypothetical protein ACR2LF_02710 [Jatrophihabitantaceae bacterium]